MVYRYDLFLSSLYLLFQHLPHAAILYGLREIKENFSLTFQMVLEAKISFHATLWEQTHRESLSFICIVKSVKQLLSKPENKFFSYQVANGVSNWYTTCRRSTYLMNYLFQYKKPSRGNVCVCMFIYSVTHNPFKVQRISIKNGSYKKKKKGFFTIIK